MTTTTTRVPARSAVLRYGTAWRDATPPVGIYHRFWGAANHDTATGVHRPIRVSATAIGPRDSAAGTWLLLSSDHCILRADDMARLRASVEAAVELPEGSHIAFSFGHSHSAGHICSERSSQPGGAMIGPYLDQLRLAAAEAVCEALSSMQDARALFAVGQSGMAAHRDFRDPATGEYVCGFNPDSQWDLPVHMARFQSPEGADLGCLVSYPCHPTTLAWGNTELSPDYIGALRETVESTSSGPCHFLLAPCGDIGPRHGYVGDTAVADSNGRQLGHAALEAWHSLDHVEGDFVYRGPVLSGATLGEWTYAGWDDAGSEFSHRRYTVELPYRDDLRSVSDIDRELERWAEAAQGVNTDKPDRAGQARAMAERLRRERERVAPLPAGDVYPFEYNIIRMGPVALVLVEGEPYYELQVLLQDALPGQTVIVGVLSEGSRCSYLPTADAYDRELYQVHVSVLASSCLETLASAIISQLHDTFS